MTDMPVFGILCCGKDISELSLSVKACGHITDILKDSGFVLGGYHTALAAKNDEKLSKMCKSKLSHLCRTCDIVFTVGCDGFAHDDILPEITAELCDSEAVFFTSNLCGISSIANYDATTSCNVRQTRKRKNSFLPSRSRAGIIGKCLLLNIRNDLSFIKATLPPLIPSIAFATSCLSGKDANICQKLNESLKHFCEIPDSQRKKFFENIQNFEIKKS